MGLLILFFLSIVIICLIPSINAFDVEGNNVVVFHEFVDNFDYPDPRGTTVFSDMSYTITFTQNSTDIVIVKIPNTLEMVENVSFDPITWGLFYDIYGEVTKYAGSCYRTYVITPTSEYSSLKLGVASVATGNIILTSYEVEQFCYEIFENPPHLKDCSLENQNHINLRGESVCVSSVKELMDRGYLV